MSVTVRPLEDDDIEAVASIFGEQSVIDGTMRLPHASLDATRERLAHRDGAIRLVAVDDARCIVGFAELETYPHTPRHRHAADLQLLAVRESARHRGVGRRLLDEVLELADNWLQLTRLGLIVWTDNLTAISLYQSAGFVIEGTMPAYVWRKGTYVDAHLMGRVSGH